MKKPELVKPVKAKKPIDTKKIKADIRTTLLNTFKKGKY